MHPLSRIFHNLGLSKVTNDFLGSFTQYRTIITNFEICECLRFVNIQLKKITADSINILLHITKTHESITKLIDNQYEDLHYQTNLEELKVLLNQITEAYNEENSESTSTLIEQLEIYSTSIANDLKTSHKTLHDGICELCSISGAQQPADTWETFACIEAKNYLHEKLKYYQEKIENCDNTSLPSLKKELGEFIVKFFNTDISDVEETESQSQKKELGEFIINFINTDISDAEETEFTSLKTELQSQLLKMNKDAYISNFKLVDVFYKIDDSNYHSDIFTFIVCLSYGFKKIDLVCLTNYASQVDSNEILNPIMAILTILGLGRSPDNTAFIAKKLSSLLIQPNETNPQHHTNITEILNQLCNNIQEVDDITPTQTNLKYPYLVVLAFLVEYQYMTKQNATAFVKLMSAETGKSNDILSLSILALSLIGNRNDLSTLITELEVNSEEPDLSKRLEDHCKLALRICGIRDSESLRHHASNLKNLFGQVNTSQANPLTTQAVVLNIFSYIEAYSNPRTQSLFIAAMFSIMYCMAHVTLTLLGIQFTAIQVASVIGVNLALLGVGVLTFTLSMKALSFKPHQESLLSHELDTNSAPVGKKSLIERIFSQVWSNDLSNNR